MEDHFEIQMVITNEYGEFKGRKFTVSESSYIEILGVARNFYTNGGFDLICEDGGFMVFAPEVIQKSILKINKRVIDV